MADAYLSAVVGGLVPLLASPVLKEAKLWWGVKDELEKLKKTVQAIQAVLLDAEEQYYKNHQVQFWVDSLKQVLYDAEDVLDELSTRELQKQVMTGTKSVKEVRLFFSGSNQLLSGVQMAHKIKDIRSKLDGIVENRKLLIDLEHREERKVMVDYCERETHSSLPGIVIGREYDKEAIIEFLVSSDCDENVPIISVVGIGGLGKTTLAQLAVNDEKVRSHFELKLWVSVTNDFSIKAIVEKILESINGAKPGGNCEMDTLKSLLHEKINGKKYLLVLDDVWNEDYEKWFSFRDLLIGGGSGSRIIVTTRLKNVAEGIRSERVYDLQGLSEADSWSLFKTLAFKRGEVESLEHEQIGKEITAMCAGVPLALRAIGRVMYLKKTIFEWKDFRDRELANAVKETGSILPTLMLSYNHLPSHLKCCFAYCSLIPKGVKLNVKLLVRRWVAQGYVRVLGSLQNIEDVGLQYFKNLLWRSFFQEVEEDELGDIRYCKMHDLMCDLAKDIARNEICQLRSNAECVNVKEGTLHLSIDSNVLTEIAESKQLERVLYDSRKVRTVLLFNGSMINEITEVQLEKLFSSLRRIRTLDLGDLAIERVPPSIAYLKQLRELNVGGSEGIMFLPDSVTQLQNLQSLVLENCKRLKELPKNTKKLINLMHLDNYGCVSLTHMPRGLGQLTSLQTLDRFVVSKDSKSGGLDELRHLNNLKGSLRIYNLQYVKNAKSEFEAANLKKKQYLQYLELNWKFDDDYECDPQDEKEEISLEELHPHKNLKWLVVLGCGKLKFPNWLSSLSNLVDLCINNCRHCPIFPPLDEFPSLKRLWIGNLTDLEYIENKSRISGSVLCFPSLEELWLENCPSLEGWRNSQSLQFQCLTYLDITSCPNLISMPSIPSVETLAVKKTNVSSMEQILKMKISVLQSTSSSPHPSSSQLKVLSLCKIEGIESLPEELMQKLTSLQQLDIIHCPGMKTLPSAIQHLTSLKILLIDSCEDLDFSDEESGCVWQLLRNLEVVQFGNMKKLASLPKGFQRVPTLGKIVIISCPNLISLPEWISNLNGLQYLHLEECPHLLERCSNNSGTDWTKIAHIPNIWVDGKGIQEFGHYKA